MTTDHGAPLGTNQHSKTAGPAGGVLLEDFALIQKLARFDRERIPERVVHARGVGAYGEFISSGDASDITRATLFAQKGKRTPMFVRFSTVIHSKGSPETLRDPRGFALKFYTDQGNWDLVGNNLPVFFIRDAIKFPDMVHSLKPSPITNRQDPNRFFDFFSHRPEATHMLTQVYSDLGVPANYRQQNGHGVHAFKLVNRQGEVHYAKFNWKSQQGVRHLTSKQASKTQGQAFNHATQDLYDHIKRGDHPRWELSVQVISAARLNDFDFWPLDATKVWPEALVPSRVLGHIVLNQVPNNFFEHVEQAAFSPAVLIPGIEASEDRLLQGRLFAYADTQRYRLGANYLALAVNRPRIPVNNNNQDGALYSEGRQGDVNYEPSVTGQTPDRAEYLASVRPLRGTTQQRDLHKTMNFAQAGDFYRNLDAAAQTRLVQNFAADLGQVKSTVVKARIVGFLVRADREYGRRVGKAVGVNVKQALTASKTLAMR